MSRRVTFDNRTLSGAQYHLLKLQTGTITKKTTKPQFIVDNFQNRDRRIFGLSFTPSLLFSEEGIVEVRLNEVRILPVEPPAQGMFENITALNVPIPPNFGLKIQESMKLEVFIWNPDSNDVSINLSCFVGDII